MESHTLEQYERLASDTCFECCKYCKTCGTWLCYCYLMMMLFMNMTRLTGVSLHYVCECVHSLFEGCHKFPMRDILVSVIGSQGVRSAVALCV